MNRTTKATATETNHTQRYRREFSKETLRPVDPFGILTPEARQMMAMGTVPPLGALCSDLYETFFQPGAAGSALQFVPVMRREHLLYAAESMNRFWGPEDSLVLVHNDRLKVVLIRWPSGKSSSIHGHPEGGCVFKVLRGRLQEKRYTPGAAPRLLSVSTCLPGSIAYIDDRMGFHSVANTGEEPALSLHAYTPGRI